MLILTTFEVDEYVFAALRAGASGFLGKSARPQALIDEIRTVTRGEALLSPAATHGLIARYLAIDAATRRRPATSSAFSPIGNAKSSPLSPPGCPMWTSPST